MLLIVNPEFPAWNVLRYMLLGSAGLVIFLLAMTLVFAILTTLIRLIFIPRTRWELRRDGVEELEKLGFKTVYRH